MARLLIIAIIIWIAYFVAKSILKSLMSPSNSGAENKASRDVSETEMIQDPECGAYFMKSKGVKGVVEGKVLHFCGEQCYEKYLKRIRGKK